MRACVNVCVSERSAHSAACTTLRVFNDACNIVTKQTWTNYNSQDITFMEVFLKPEREHGEDNKTKIDSIH